MRGDTIEQMLSILRNGVGHIQHVLNLPAAGITGGAKCCGNYRCAAVRRHTAHTYGRCNPIHIHQNLRQTKVGLFKESLVQHTCCTYFCLHPSITGLLRTHGPRHRQPKCTYAVGCAYFVYIYVIIVKFGGKLCA